MRTTSSEWECIPGSAPGLIESMDAAGFEAGVHPPRSGLPAGLVAAFSHHRTHHAQPHGARELIGITRMTP
jgi:hypothetical protein